MERMKYGVFQEEPSQNHRFHVAKEPIRSSPVPDADYERKFCSHCPGEREIGGAV